MRTLAVAFVLLVNAVHAWGGGESAVLYLDGARLEYQAVARKGYLEMPLPADMLPNSLRVSPLGACTVLRVEEAAAPAGRKADSARTALTERRAALSDRLAALRAREEIFRAAAKSQSGRAPRKTKTNPDPMEVIRKGTDFAVARLDAARVASSRVERELAATDEKLAALEKRAPAGRVARIWLSSDRGRVRISCLVSGLRWVPRYDFRLSGDGSARIELRAGIPKATPSAALSVVPATLADAYGSDRAPEPVSSELDLIASFKVALTMEELVNGPVPSLSFGFANSSGTTLPAGEAFGYWRGEYLGKSGFETCGPGVIRSLAFGR